MHLRIEKLTNFKKLQWNTFTLNERACNLAYKLVASRSEVTLNFTKEDLLANPHLIQELVTTIDLLTIVPENALEADILKFIAAARLENIRLNVDFHSLIRLA